MNTFQGLRDYLHRGVAGYWYLWVHDGSEYKQSIWAKIGEDLPIPNHRSNVYFGVNPSRVLKTVYERAKLEDIAGLNCVYAEFDIKDYGSLDAAAQHIRSLKVRPSVVVASGGGYHAYYFLNETFVIRNADDLKRARHLQDQWVEYARSDKGAKDISRVLRVPGTRNWKEEYAPDFPPVAMVFSEMRRLYSLEQIESVLPKPKPLPDPKPMRFGKGYVEKALQNETERVLSALEGERNSTLNVASFALGKLVAQGGISRTRVEGVLLCAAIGAGLPQNEAMRTIRSGLDGAQRA